MPYMPRPTVRSRALVAVLAAGAFGVWTAQAAAEVVTLEPDPRFARYGSTVRVAGAITPARQTAVQIYRRTAGGWQLVAEDHSGNAGRYSLTIAARRPGRYVARTDAAQSTPALLRIRPILTTSFAGLKLVGAPLRLTGRLRPADAGKLVLRIGDRTRAVAVGARGRFAAKLPTQSSGILRLRLVLRPESNFVALARRLRPRIRAPFIGIGSRGPAVRFLERRLDSLKYVLRDVDRGFHGDTLEAVYAFQKVERLRRDGVVTPTVWHALARARTPRAAVERGSHIEVDKSRQVLFEVRRGRVVRIVHVSTGATGNTPLGRWRIYRKSPGFNSLSMYYSMYFLRGFAVHGYHSVPPWPASHGCVRMPNWFAPRLYSRWGLGSVIWVLPTTSRKSPLWRRPGALRNASVPTALGPVGP